MGSLRNPIGPLPSSIYWRRRAIALSLVALLAVLTIWALTSRGGGGDKQDSANGKSTSSPSTITPGPSQSGTAISEQPGGREETGGTGTESGPGSGQPGSGGPDGTGGTDSGGTGSSTGTGSGPGGGSGTGGTGGGGSPGERVPAGSPLPNCRASELTLALNTPKVPYEPGEKPSFRLVVTNSSDTACKADLGPRAAVLTITSADDGGDKVWSSKDCPRTRGALLLKVPARGSVTHVVEWDRVRSAPQCATPPAGAVRAGTYLAEARIAGEAPAQVSIRLERD
ncbi:hypothetical protein [Streptomyces sp. CAU 1734]|uniref:hypothetical protein n=1 Tax=Streptomyces sp. CAU 1734 TaxID=3140360 RepID=UPI00325FEB9D